MPRVIINPPSPGVRLEPLVERLARELAAPGEGTQPLFIERCLPVSKSRHVHVIWEEWRKLAHEERAAVIIRAYVKFEGAKEAANITVALGILPEDAVTFGLLPYSLRPEREHEADHTRYRVAFTQEVGNTVMGVGSGELRYADLEEAEKALRRIGQHAPDTSWIILHQDDEEDEE